jgi:hypothetical protein
VYWNGNFIGQNGQPAADLASERDGVSDNRHYIPPAYIKSQGNVLAIRYSAHGYKRLHLPLAFSFHITNFENEKYQRLVTYVPAFILIGGIGAAAIYFAALFFRRRFDRGSLWLALMFLMVVIQSASETSRALLSYSYLGQLSRIGITFLAAYASGLFLNLYLLNYLGVNRLKRPVLLGTHFCAIVAVALFYANFDTATFTVLAIFVAAAIGLTAHGVYRKQRYALPMLLVLGVFASCFPAGSTLFLDRYYFGAMALLAGTLFVVQASLFRETEEKVSASKLTISRLELDLLKRQIQPHFIMNTLTALSEWILTSPEQSVDMIETLSDEFRLLNEFVGKKLVPLASEINLCRAHLKLMSYRQDQHYSLETTIETEGVLVPPAVLHTLIENALTHNRYLGESTHFRLEQQSLHGDRIELTLTTPPGSSAHKTDTPVKTGGLGLSYVRARLEESWGNNFSFSDGQSESGGWRSVIIMPAQYATQETA